MNKIEIKEKISHGTKFFPFAYYAVNNFHPRYNMTAHWHEECELIRIIKGSFKLKINTTPYELKGGDIVFINSGYIHSGIPNDCIYECIVFDISFLKKERSMTNSFLNSLITFQQEIQTFYSKETEEVITVLNNIFKTIKEKKKGYDMKLFGLLYYFLGIVEEYNMFSNSINVNFSNKKKILKLKKVLSVIHKNYMHEVSLEDLAESINMNTNYFCKFFKSLTGTSPIDYLTIYRLECAKKKLKETELSITEVAYDCGFNDSSYFTKVFKKYNNITPTKFLSLNKDNK